MTNDWQWNELRQIGTDYADVAEVAAYDARMGTFRNVDTENRALLGLLGLPVGASVLEIGCGTGRFARAAAATGLSVTAIDVSNVMLDYVRQKAAEERLAIATRHAGFLTMDFPAAGFDAVVSGAALHHLPDAWKFVALRNIHRVLKPGGQFLLGEVVFSMAENETPEACFGRFAGAFPNMRTEAVRHVAQEYSTYDWIMEGLLARAGFTIRSKAQQAPTFTLYRCAKA